MITGIFILFEFFIGVLFIKLFSLKEEHIKLSDYVTNLETKQRIFNIKTINNQHNN